MTSALQASSNVNAVYKSKFYLLTYLLTYLLAASTDVSGRPLGISIAVVASVRLLSSLSTLITRRVKSPSEWSVIDRYAGSLLGAKSQLQWPNQCRENEALCLTQEVSC